MAEKKQSVEKALAEREKSIAAKELELETLSNQVANFPAMLEKEIAAACKQVEEHRLRNISMKRICFTKEMQGETKSLQQTMSSLQAKIKDQDSFITSLNERASTVGTQVRTIALKALYSASSLRYSSLTSSKKGRKGRWKIDAQAPSSRY